MAKKSRAQKIQESAAANNDATPKKHLSKYALKKIAQQNGSYVYPEHPKQLDDLEQDSTDSAVATPSQSDSSAQSGKSKSQASNNKGNTSTGSTRLSLRNRNNKQSKGKTELTDEEYLSHQERRKAQAKAKAIKAALEGASGIEKAEPQERSNTRGKRNVSFTRKGKIITVVRKGTKNVPKVDPKVAALQEAKALEHKAKRIRHAQAVRDARNEALAKLEAEGKTYERPIRDPEAIPDKIQFDRKTVETSGVLIKDRLPNLTDLAERQAAMMPHNRRDQLLFAPIKRETKPIKGTDFMVKFLDSWSRRNDPQGIFTPYFDKVKSIRQNENGIAFIGLPAFLKFLEGATKNKIIDDYAFDFRQFIKRREITDFIGSMQKPALDWAKHRPALEPFYAFVYFDTYPVHIKLGKKRVINVQVLFILGVTLDGRKDILGIIPDLNSSRVSVSFWDNILSHLKELGCSEICFIVAAFKCRYLERSVKTYFPQATMIFNLMELLQFDSFSLPQEMRGDFMADAQVLAESPNYEQGYQELLAMRSKWEGSMKEGETILQGSLDYLKVHTLLKPEDRKIFTTQKIVSQAAALLMGNKAPDDFFSDNAEMLTYLFYRYLLIGKQYWIEHQDYAVNNLSFAKIFSQLRHFELSGSKLLNTLLSEKHQEFMYRHFGQFGNGPVFNLNPNKKRISLSGQIDDNAAVRGDMWNDTSNAALNTSPESLEAAKELAQEQAHIFDPEHDLPQESTNDSQSSLKTAHGPINEQSGSLVQEQEKDEESKLKSDLAQGFALAQSSPNLAQALEKETLIKDINGSQLTLNDSHLVTSPMLLGINTTKSIFESEVSLTDNSPTQDHIFNMASMRTYESNAFRAFGGLDFDDSVPAFLKESSATLTLNSTSSNFIEQQDLHGYNHESKAKEPSKNDEHKEIKHNSKKTLLAEALRFEYPEFTHKHILLNGRQFILTHAALGDLDQAKLRNQAMHNNSDIDIDGIEKIDGTYGFKILRSKRMSHKSGANQGNVKHQAKSHNSSLSHDKDKTHAQALDNSQAQALSQDSATLSLNASAFGIEELSANSTLSLSPESGNGLLSLGLDKSKDDSLVPDAHNIAKEQATSKDTSNTQNQCQDELAQGQENQSKSSSKTDNLHASYSRHFKNGKSANLFNIGEELGTLKHQYDVDSVAGLDGLEKINFANEISSFNSQQPSNYLNSVSSNIQRANAVIGMLRPSIAQALRKERLELKKQALAQINICLGSGFTFDGLNNVIHQVTPIFRSAMQNKIAMKAEKEAEKKAKERQRKKEKARALYLKRQEQKAALEQEKLAKLSERATHVPGFDGPVNTQSELTDKDFEPLKAQDFNPLSSVLESSALSAQNSNSFEGPITLTNESSSNLLSQVSTNESLLVTNSVTNQSLELKDATTLDGLFSSSDSEDSKLTLIKPADAKVQVVASEYRSTIAEKMAISSPTGVQTQKPDTTIKAQD